MISEQFISKIKSVSKSAPDNSQMVTDLISLENRIETTRGWPQWPSANGENGRSADKDEF
jgi:hypothetical protein